MTTFSLAPLGRHGRHETWRTTSKHGHRSRKSEHLKRKVRGIVSLIALFVSEILPTNQFSRKRFWNLKRHQKSTLQTNENLRRQLFVYHLDSSLLVDIFSMSAACWTQTGSGPFLYRANLTACGKPLKWRAGILESTFHFAIVQLRTPLF